MDFELVDFSTIEPRKRRAILRRSVKDMDRVAMARKREGLDPRGFFLQVFNINQIAKMHHGNE